MTIQTLTIGDFVLVSLAGEICVGYALRLKEELSPRLPLIAGYTNGMVGYVPTVDMMSGGGYEVDGAYRYDMVPAPYAPGVEERICETVQEMTGG